MELRARKGQAAFGLHLETLELRPLHIHHDTVLLARFDNAAELAVIERHLGADSQMGENVRRFAYRLDGQIVAERRRIANQPESIAGPQPLARPPLDLADPELRTGNVHQDRNAPADCLRRRARVRDHRAPDIGVVMRAVDPHHVRPAARDLQHVVRFPCRLGRQGHQDVANPAVGRSSQQGMAYARADAFRPGRTPRARRASPMAATCRTTKPRALFPRFSAWPGRGLPAGRATTGRVASAPAEARGVRDAGRSDNGRGCWRSRRRTVARCPTATVRCAGLPQ